MELNFNSLMHLSGLGVSVSVDLLVMAHREAYGQTSAAAIAEVCGLSNRSVERAIARLKAAGFFFRAIACGHCQQVFLADSDKEVYCDPCKPIGNAEKTKAAVRRWRQRHPGKVQTYLNKNPLLRRARAARTNMVRRSFERGYPCTIKVEELVAMFKQASYCPCCGVKLDYEVRGMAKDHSPSCDKIIPSLGYVPGNVMVICNRCNILKRDAHYQELEHVASFTREMQQKVLS